MANSNDAVSLVHSLHAKLLLGLVAAFTYLLSYLVHANSRRLSVAFRLLFSSIHFRRMYLGTSNKLVPTINSHRLAVQVLVGDDEQHSTSHVLVISRTLGRCLVFVLLLGNAARCVSNGFAGHEWNL